uniref:Uncharacterized protein n=1 Tax=Rhizophora mucronata TaxID=61149 RepID=A0A2P2P109_RHIMU
MHLLPIKTRNVK